MTEIIIHQPPALKTIKSYKNIIPTIILGICVFALAYYLGKTQKFSNDWDNCFRPGAQYLITGKNPNDLENCHWVPWSLLPLVTIAFLPADVGRAILASVAVVTYFLVAKKMGASLLVAALMVANPLYLFHNILNPNIDWLVAIGYVLPPQIGLFFSLTKPQLGIGLIVYWLVEAYREGGMRRIISTFLPVTLLFLATTIIYGPYFFQYGKLLDDPPGWNLSFWPYSILVGLPLLVWSVVKRQSQGAILGGPFFSPYMGYYSWPIAFLGLLPRHQMIALAISVSTFILLVLAGIIIKMI